MSIISQNRAHGRLTDAYEIEEEIGRGGMGVVYRARQRATDQLVAIKKLLHSPSNAESQAEDEARFWREVKLVGKLTSPYTVRLIDAGFDQGQPFMALEFVEGEALDKMLSRGPLDFPTTQRLMSHVLESLGEAHDSGVVHRDLKPANIMITGKGPRISAKVLDFGIAGILDTHKENEDQDITQAGQIRGTVAYMAPEQFNFFEDPTPASDLYAMGLIILECLTGERAVQGPSMRETCRKQITEPTPIPSTAMTEVVVIKMPGEFDPCRSNERAWRRVC